MVATGKQQNHIKLIHGTTRGYVAMAHKDGDAWIQKLYTVQESITAQIEELDSYMSVHSFTNKRRGADMVTALKWLYIDLDYGLFNCAPDLIRQQVDSALAQTHAPVPTLIISSGRGAHLYWQLEPTTIANLPQWQACEDTLIRLFKNHGVDTAVRDASRVMRLPDTYNSKSPQYKTELLSYNSNIYTLDKLATLLEAHSTRVVPSKQSSVTKLPNPQKNATTVKYSRIMYLKNIYTLQLARQKDILTLVHIRDGQMTGVRELALWIYRCCTSTYESHETALELTLQLNNSFTNPLPDTEVTRATASANGQRRMTNKYIIDAIKITAEEQAHLTTLICKKIKYARDNGKRKPISKSSRQETKTARYAQWERDIQEVQGSIKQLIQMWSCCQATAYNRLKRLAK